MRAWSCDRTWARPQALSCAPRVEQPEDISRYAWLSLATGILVLALKTLAWQLTGSVGLLSDALESTVNIGAALVAVFALRAANRPADAEHHFGHGKAEYLSAMVEGVLILGASAAIIATAVNRLLSPQPLEQVGIGLVVSVIASVLNGGRVALILMRVGRAHRSMVLVADGKHLMTDVWTSAGVVVGVGAVALTGWVPLDPLIALAVGANILWTGWKLLRDSVSSLLDERLSDADIDEVVAVLAAHEAEDVRFHALQTRESGRQRFVSMHVLVPGAWTVAQGHDLGRRPRPDIRLRPSPPHLQLPASAAHRGPTGMGRPTARRSGHPRRGPLERRLSPPHRPPRNRRAIGACSDRVCPQPSSAKDFFAPLAVGAPAPLREIPARPSRVIHFFDPSNAKMAAKIPDMVGTVDVLLGNLEDAVKAENKEAARAGLVRIGKATDFGTTQLWTRVNALDSPWVLDDLTTLVTEIGDKLDVVMIPKVQGAEDIHYVDRLLAQLEARAGLTAADPRPRDPRDRPRRGQRRGDLRRLARGCRASRSARPTSPPTAG